MPKHGWTEEDLVSYDKPYEELKPETFPELASQPYPRLIKRLTWLDLNGGSILDGRRAVLDYFEDAYGNEVGYLMDRLPFDY